MDDMSFNSKIKLSDDEFVDIMEKLNLIYNGIIRKNKAIGDIETYGDNGFEKREIVIQLKQYPQHILIEFIQNNCELLDNYSIGQTVRIKLILEVESGRV